MDAILQAGGLPSTSLVGQSGYSDEYIQAIRNYYAAQQAAAASGGGRSGGGGSSGGGSGGGDDELTMSLTTAKQAASAGVFSDEVLRVLRANGYTDEMLSAIYGYNPQSGTSAGSPTVDLGSVLNLGYGTIGSDQLADLENQGVIESYVEDGKIKFRKTGRGAPSLLGGIGGF